MQPPKFSGDGQDVRIWLKKYQQIALFNGWNEEKQVANVPLCLEGLLKLGMTDFL